MKSVSIFILLSMALSHATVAQLPDSLEQYYSSVNQAELAIVDAQYVDALNFYETAFSTNSQPFKKDVYNRAVCEVLVVKFDRAYSDFENLLDYGYELDSLMGKEELLPFFKSRYGQKLRQHAKKNIKRYNLLLRNVYDSLLTADQEFRIKEGSYEVYGDTIEKIDHANSKMVLELIDRFGFPSQTLIGTYPNFDYSPISIIVLHDNVGSRFGQIVNYTEILYRAVYSGQLDSRVALPLLTGSTGNDFYGFSLSGLVKNGYEWTDDAGYEMSELSGWGFQVPDPQKEKELNDSRHEIGLCTLEDSRIKTIYNMKDFRFLLHSPGEQRIYYWASEQDYRDAVERMVIIE